MAKGDVVGTNITSVPNGSNLDFQPASGVEVLLGATSAGVTYYNGTLSAGTFNGNIKVLLTNSIYARISNTSGGSQVHAIRGIQIK